MTRGGGYILGLNAYTHSAAACVLEPEGGIAFALQKERLTRKKHDGGDVAEVVRQGLEAVGIGRGELGLVVANTHLFRIGPFERRLPFEVALNAWPPSYLDPFNLLPETPRHELSHHLAHAWSVLPLAPFEEGLIAVMDGMGSTYEDVQASDAGYTTDRDLARHPGFVQVPERLDPAFRWREAETVYHFRGLELRLVLKRWVPHRSPDYLYNYGFQDLESLGGVYSRVSSHLFGDWNVCGKVMGLAPWALAGRKHGTRASEIPRIMTGPLERLRVHEEVLARAAPPNAWSQPRHRKAYARLASAVQRDLEDVVVPFLRRLRRRTKARHLAFTGGVALNATLNGEIARACGFEQVFVPPHPGDEGVALGCAAFGHHVLGGRAASPGSALPLRGAAARKPERPPARGPVTSFLGRTFAKDEIEAALDAFAPWIVVDPLTASGDEPAFLRAVVRELRAHRIVGWFQGRSELGPRALGARSLLAHPGRKSTSARLNLQVKRREAFRPFAPTVLAERQAAWFHDAFASSFMSFTTRARARVAQRIPAVLHVDGSARVQTLRREDHPRFYALIEELERQTGLPLVLNTSFNIEGEPIVESPRDALRTFLDGGIDMLALEDRIVRPRAYPRGAALARARPERDPAVTTNVTCDASGEVLQALLMAHGRTHESDLLEIGLLERADGSRTVTDLVSGLRREGARGPDIHAALERLWRRRCMRL